MGFLIRLTKNLSLTEDDRNGAMEITFWFFVAGVPLGLLFLTATLLEPKWFFFLFAGGLIAVGSLAVPNRKKYYLLFLALSVPVSIHLTPLFTPSSVNRSTYGLLLLISHVPLAALFFIELTGGRAGPSYSSSSSDTSKKSLVSLAGLFSAGVISVIMARSRLYGVFDLFALVTSIALFFYVSRYIRNTREIHLLVSGLIYTTLLQAIIAIGQYLTSSSLGLDFFGAQEIMQGYAGLASISRSAGTMGHPNSLAIYFDLLLPLFLTYLFYLKKGGTRMFLAVAFMLCLFGLFVTMSRGGLFCTSVALALILVLTWRKQVGIARAILALSLVGGLCLVIIFSTSNPIRQRFLENDYGNARGRITLVEVATEVIRHNPFFGVGLNNFIDTAGQYDRTPEQIVSLWNTPVHNLFLFIAGETGLVGLTFFALFLWSVLTTLRPALSSPDPFLSRVGLGILIGFLAFFGHSQVDYCLWTHFIPFWFMAGLAVSTGRIAADLGAGGLVPAESRLRG
ncbi:MAG: O-antigen ligase family protein [Deltaproteobacteria bacterium]|nr:O-antigen ligase family protein [Deltaproteobacteria bacterium]